MKKRQLTLEENEIPRSWYNVVADMPNKPLPPLNPQTKEPIGPESLEPLFPKELIKQEISNERWIEIPDEIRKKYATWRPTTMYRAYELEKFLDTPAKIYYKYEGASPTGSHKLNTAMAQAFYNKEEGVKRITTETGAGQWGCALSFACQQFGLKCEVYMVKISYDQKPYRKIMMNVWGADVFSSPSTKTEAGRTILAQAPDTTGSLGIAISEAIERAATSNDTKYALGSVLNHVLMHQTVIGQEALLQLQKADDFADIVIAPIGGGSNFSGLILPFLQKNLCEGKNIRCIASEPASCPKLTRGVFRYDFGDAIGMTPLIPMYTLGHNFVPAPIHAGGLRYHGASAIVSQLLKDNLIEARAHDNLEIFEAGVQFAKTEGIIPAPEAAHAIATVIQEAKQCKKAGTPKTILFNLCGHGYFDMKAYEDYFSGKIVKHELTEQTIKESLAKLNTPLINNR